MATVSFALLNQDFYIHENNHVTYSGNDAVAAGASYSHTSTGADDWEYYGTGITETGGLLDGGTVTRLEVDLDNDSGETAFEISISGLSVAATDFAIGAGTNADQLTAFWLAALVGDDTLDFTLANYAINLYFTGDGAYLNGPGRTGGDDSFNDSGTGLSGGSVIAGDYLYADYGVAGGSDSFTVGAAILAGDFYSISAAGVGGADAIAPARLVDNLTGAFRAMGDAYSLASGTLTGGDDLIDLRLTDLTGFTQTTFLYGDVFEILSGATLAGGADTIYGSSRADEIHGEYGLNSGIATGGNDLLYGEAGADLVFGEEGADSLYGGVANDTMLGGAGADRLSGDDQNDVLIAGDGDDVVLGGTGFDLLLGEAGDDAMKGGSVADTIVGGLGDDKIAGQGGLDTLIGDEGSDTIRGNTGRDLLDGGDGADALAGRGGADTLDGGAGDDVLTGKGGADIFVYGLGGDMDTIRKLAPGSGAGDVIHIAGFGAAFDSFAEILLAASDNGVSTTIDFGGGDVLILKGVVVGDLAADDFTFS